MKQLLSHLPSVKWWNRFVLVLVPFALLTVLMSLWLYQTEREAALDGIAANSLVQLGSMRREVAGTINDSATDALLLANDVDLVHEIGANEVNWSVFGEHFVQWLRAKPIYDHVHVLGLSGEERVRVQLNGGDPTVVPARELQSKRGYDYFESSRSLARGRVYISSLDLAVERGAVEVPYKPVLRFITPLYDENGNKHGLLALDLMANRLLEQIRESAPATGEIWLIDQDGQWLMGGLPEDGFTRQTGLGRLLTERDPLLFDAINHTAVNHMVRQDGLWVFARLRPTDSGEWGQLGRPQVPLISHIHNDHWHLVLHYDQQALLPLLARSRRIVWLFAIGAAALSIAAATLLTTVLHRSAARQEAEAAFFRLFERAPMGVMILDAHGNGLFFNEYWSNLSSVSASLSLGEGWVTCLDEQDRGAVRDRLRHAANGGVEQSLELRLHRADGSTRWVVCRIVLLPPTHGGRARFIVGVSDANEHKQHEAKVVAALQLLEGVVGGCGDPIMVIDLGYKVSLLNVSFGQTFGLLYGDAPEVGTTLSAWLHRWPADRDAMMGHFDRAMRGSTSHVRMTLGPAKRLFDGAFSPLYSADGAVSGAILFARDVTDMARMQARVARNEELFRAVFTGSLDAVFVLEAVRDRIGVIADFRYVEVSGPPVTQGGRTREDYIGKLVSERNPMFAQELGYSEHFRRVIETSEPFIEEIYFDGDGVPPGWYENRVVSMGWGVTLTSRNITSRKQAERALATSEGLQRNILDSAPYCIIAVDRDGLISVFNKAAENLLGYKSAELVGRHSAMLFHDTREIARCAIELSEQYGLTVEPGIDVFNVLASRQDVDTREWTFIDKQKRRIPVLLSLSPRRLASGEIIGNMGIAYDISRQKEAEAERDRLYAVVEAIPDTVAMADLDGNIIYLNQAGRRLRGLAPDEPLDGLHISRAWTEWSYRLITTVALPQAMAGRPWTGDTQLMMPDGSLVDMRQLLVAPRMGGREPVFTATVLHDLSEIRAMEAKMVEEDALLNSVLESVQDAIVVLDDMGVIQSLNPAVADVFHYGVHEVIGKDVAMLLREPCARQLREDMAHYRAQPKRVSKAIRRENLGMHKDGSLFPMELTMSEIRFADHRIYTVVMRDISERKAAEASLLANIDELTTTQKALASANEQLLAFNAELNRMAQVDGLTGVANRRAFDHALHAEWGRAARMTTPLSLLMIDVDHFKRYNDGYGHQMGDECLKQVAAVLRGAVVRPSDFVARYGGEEFVIILPETSGTGAVEVAERVRRDLEAAAIPHAFSSTSAHVTVSVGAATLLALNGVAPTVLVAAADHALYQSKEHGRNRVTSAA